MYIVILITVPSLSEAESIAAALIKEKLAACVNMVSGVKSVFWWEGKMDKAEEVLLVVKSKKAKLAKIISKVKSLHSYQVPEIIAIPLIGGYKPYLDWIDESLCKQC